MKPEIAVGGQGLLENIVEQLQGSYELQSMVWILGPY